MTDNEMRNREPTPAEVAGAENRIGGNERAGRAGDDREGVIDDRIGDREVALPRTTSRAADVPDDARGAHLLSPDFANELRPRWTDIQASFVDEPRAAVEQADKLVSEAIHRLAESFADQRETLEREWDRGEEVSTEELRQVLQHYRAFFDRLLRI